MSEKVMELSKFTHSKAWIVPSEVAQQMGAFSLLSLDNAHNAWGKQ